MNTNLTKNFPFIYAICFSYGISMIFWISSVQLVIFSFLMSLCAFFINKKYISGQMIYSTKDFVNIKSLSSNFFIVAGKKIKKYIISNEEKQLSNYTSIVVNNARILSICASAIMFYFIFKVTKIIEYERVGGGIFFICIVLTIISMNINFYIFPLFVQLLAIVLKLSFYGQQALGPNALIYELIYIALLFLILILIHNLSEQNKVVYEKAQQNLQITKIVKQHLEVFIPFIVVLILTYLVSKDAYSFKKKDLPYKYSSEAKEGGLEAGEALKAAEAKLLEYKLKKKKEKDLEKEQEKDERKQNQEKLKAKLEELKLKQEKLKEDLEEKKRKQEDLGNKKEVVGRRQKQNELKMLQKELESELEINKKSQQMIKKKIENNNKKLEEIRKKQIQEELEERKQNELENNKENEAKNNKHEEDIKPKELIGNAISKLNSAQNNILKNEIYVSNKEEINKLFWGIILLLILTSVIYVYRYVKKRLKMKGMTIEEIINYDALEMLKRDIRRIIRKRMRPEKEVKKVYSKFYKYVQNNIYMNEELGPPPTILAKDIYNDFPEVKDVLLTISNMFCNVKYGAGKIKKEERKLFRANMNQFIEYMHDLNVNSQHDHISTGYDTREVESIKRSKKFIEV